MERVSYPQDGTMAIIADINGFMKKRILVDSRSSYNVLTWEAIIGLQVDITKLKKVITPLVGIKGKPVKVKGSIETKSIGKL